MSSNWLSKALIVSHCLANGQMRASNLTQIRVKVSGWGFFSVRSENHPKWSECSVFLTQGEHSLLCVVPTECVLQIAVVNIAGRNTARLAVGPVDHGIRDVKVLVPKINELHKTLHLARVRLKPGLVPKINFLVRPSLSRNIHTLLTQRLFANKIRITSPVFNKLLGRITSVKPRLIGSLFTPRLPSENVKLRDHF